MKPLIQGVFILIKENIKNICISTIKEYYMSVPVYFFIFIFMKALAFILALAVIPTFALTVYKTETMTNVGLIQSFTVRD